MSSLDGDKIRSTAPTGPEVSVEEGAAAESDSRVPVGDSSSRSKEEGAGAVATSTERPSTDVAATGSAATKDSSSTSATTERKAGVDGNSGVGGATSTSASNVTRGEGSTNRDDATGEAANSRLEADPTDVNEARCEDEDDGGDGDGDQPQPPAPSFLPIDLDDVPRATRDWHAELLLGLFVRCGEAELSSLARRAGSDLSVACTAGRGLESVNEAAPDSSTLTLVPEVMKTLASASASRPPSHPKTLPTSLAEEAERRGAGSSVSSSEPPLIDVPASWKRSDSASLSLAQVERHVQTKFRRARTAKINCDGGGEGGDRAQRSADDANAAAMRVEEGGDEDEKEAGGGGDGSPPSERKRKRGASAPEEDDDDDSSVEPPFRPFTLLYNECTMSAVSRWAATDFSKLWPPAPDRNDDDDDDGPSPAEDTDVTDRHFPATSVAFRRCSVCHMWGHYEVDCERMREGDVVSRIAPAIKVQRTLARFVEQVRSIHSKGRGAKLGDGSGGDSAVEKVVINLKTGAVCSRPLPQAESAVAAKEPTNVPAGTNDNKDGGSDEECETKHSFCQACNSAFRDDDILLCDGCDAPYHFQCLDPPLPCVPEGDWFCHACSGYDSDVSSVADVEGCDGFVIEQRKRSLATACDDEEGTHVATEGNDSASVVGDRWSAPVNITKRIRSGEAIPGCERKIAAADKAKMASELKPSSKRDSAGGDRKRSLATTCTVSTGTDEEDEWEDADAEEEDGIVILSRAQDSVPDLNDELPDLLQSDMVEKEKSDPSRHVITEDVVGCTVAWHIDVPSSAATDGDASNHSINNNGRTTGPMMLMGSVISVDQSGEAALVRALPRFESIASSLDVASLQNSQHGGGLRTIVRAPCDLGSSFWIPLRALKLVATPRPPKSRDSVVHRPEGGENEMRASHIDHTRDEVDSREAEPSKESRPKICDGDETGEINPSAISESPSALSHSLSPTESQKEGMDPAAHAHEESVYQAERILDERSIKVGGTVVKQFLVKWKSFDMEDCTWEPQQNILSENLLRIFKVDKLEKELRDTVEAQDCSSVTSNVIEALKEGRQRLLDAEGGRRFNPVGRVCPFCQNWFKNPVGLLGHLRKHQYEPNYGLIREASKLGYDQVFGTS